jgi:hypothetical protein
MIKRTSHTHEILSERKRKIESASSQLLDNKVEAAENDLKWVDVANNILEKTTSRKHMILWVVMIGMICLLLVGFSLYLRIPSTNISADIVATSVRLNLLHPFVTKAITTGELSISNLKSLSNPSLSIKTTGIPPFGMLIENAKINFKKLTFDSGCILQITSFQGKTMLLFKNDSVNGEFDVYKGQMTYDTASEINIDKEIPESFMYSAISRTDVDPVKIELSSDSIEFSLIQTGSLSFDDEMLTTSSNSTIVSGLVSILPTGSKIDLVKGQTLKITGIDKNRMKRMEIISKNGLIHLRFDASVNHISVGSADFQEDLRPSVIENYYYQKKYALIWGAIVGIFGLLWTLRSNVFKL